jgi:hypothetical protein
VPAPTTRETLTEAVPADHPREPAASLASFALAWFVLSRIDTAVDGRTRDPTRVLPRRD